MTPIARIERWVFIYFKIEYMKKGKVIDRVILTKTKEIMSATYQQFDHTKRCLKGCDEVSVDIVDFVIKE